MDAKELLDYEFGQIIYSISLIEGFLKREEKETLKAIWEKAPKNNQIEMDITAIIFTLQNSENYFSSQDSFDMGIKNMKLDDNHLTPELFNNFCEIVNQIAETFPPITHKEKNTINDFKVQLPQFVN